MKLEIILIFGYSKEADMNMLFKRVELGAAPLAGIMLMIALGFVALPVYIHVFAVAASVAVLLHYVLRYVFATGCASEMFVKMGGLRTGRMRLPFWAFAVLLVLASPFVNWAIGWIARFVGAVSWLTGAIATFAVPLTIVILALTLVLVMVKGRRSR
ncbi:MAG: hypothetical protein PVI21_01715 [Candidatus Woesebacteria bacterium]